MKYLLRERMQENQSFLGRCKQFLGQALQVKSDLKEMPNGVDDFVAGLSPETLLKLQRVQGNLKAEWTAAATVPFAPTQGEMPRWTRPAQKAVPVTRPKIRVQLRRLESEPVLESTEKVVSEVRGLDDIFPERVTSFFGEEKQKPREKAKSPLVIDYRVVTQNASEQKMPETVSQKMTSEAHQPIEPTSVEQALEPVFNGFDESWRKKVKWPMVSKTQSSKPRTMNPMKAPEWVNPQPPTEIIAPAETLPVPVQKQPEPAISWATAFWTLMNAKISETLAQRKSAVMPEARLYSEPQMISPKAAHIEARSMTLPKRDPLKSDYRSKPMAKAPTVSALTRATGMDTRDLSRMQPVPKMQTPKPKNQVRRAVESIAPPVVSQTLEAPVLRPDATLLVSKRRKPFSQVAQEAISKPMAQPASVAKAEVSHAPAESNHIDYMWRNNQILAKSISHLADQYFQQSALEQSTGF